MSHQSRLTYCIILVTALLMAVLPACSPPPVPASPTPDSPSVSVQRPTRTPLPTVKPTGTELSLTPQPMIEPVAIPACKEDGTGDAVIFNELLGSLASTLNEADGYRYRTLYRYTEGGSYADGDLSVEVVGALDSLLTSPAESFSYPFGSQSYQRSQVVLTDLRNGSRSEAIVTQGGFWVLGLDDHGWVAFEPATPGDISNLGEIFSPYQVASFLIGGGGLMPGVRAEAPAMMRAETLDGRQVTHRCWIPPAYEGYDVNAYLIHWENTYTFLSEAEVHLWTTEDDTQLVRLALTAKHNEERQGLSDYADEDEFTQHDLPRDFLLWMEISDVDAPVEIEPPPADLIALTIPPAEKPTTDISAPYNDLSLPAGAERAGVFGGDLEKWPPERLTTTPREFRWLDSSLLYGFYGYESALDHYFGLGWSQTPADRRPVYEAEIGLKEAAAFYLEEMGRRGWLLEEKFLQLGVPVLYLFFERDGVKLPIILETKKAGTTTISTILPPADDILEAILSGWVTYTTQNSDISGDSIQAIAFDGQGRAWIGTNNGLSVFDGEAWTVEKPGESVTALAADLQGRVWVGIDKELSAFDGKTWQTYNALDTITALAPDKSGRIWCLGGWDTGVSVFDGKTFTSYEPGEIGLPGGHNVVAIASDNQGGVWIGTSGGGVYMFDGQAWNIVLKAKSPPNTTYMDYAIEDLAIDSDGRVWIGTQEGLSVFNGEDWIKFSPDISGMPFQGVEALTIDPYDRVWVGGLYGAVSVLETDGTWSTYTPIQGGGTGFSMNALAVDPEGRIWVGISEGLNVFNSPKPASIAARELPEPTPLPPPPTPMPMPGPGWTSYTTENSGLLSNAVNDVAIDGQDRVWVGTSRGVSVFSPTGEWIGYTLANTDLMDDRVKALAIDAQDRVWIGTGYDLASLASDGTWKMYNTPEDSFLSNPTLEELLVDVQGGIWIAKSCTDSCNALSLLGLDGKLITYSSENSGLASEYINDLALDTQGRIWIATFDGVSVLAPNDQWTNFSEADLGLTGDIIWVSALEVDEQDQVWIGSSGNGIIVLAPDGSRTAYTTANSGLADDYIDVLLVDNKGRVWAGTGVGLSVLSSDGRWESYTYEDSDLIEGTLSSLAMDSQGRLWIGTDAGLGVFVPSGP